MTCVDRWCPECKDRMIHQNNRGEHEASSGILQWIHDNVPRVMDVIDDDGNPHGFDIIRRKIRPRLWRRIEHKHRAGKPRDSQTELLPIIAASIAGSITRKMLHPASGVFIVWADPPFNSGRIAIVHPHLPFRHADPAELSGTPWKQFWTAIDISHGRCTRCYTNPPDMGFHFCGNGANGSPTPEQLAADGKWLAGKAD